VATALAEQRPGQVAALALIDTGPSPDAYIDQGLLGRLLLAPLPGRLLWRLRTQATIRKVMRTAFTRPIDIPDAIIQATLGMTHRALAATARASVNYLQQRSLPARLITALGLPVLVIFGTDDHRWRSSSAAAYRAVPGARVDRRLCARPSQALAHLAAGWVRVSACGSPATHVVRCGPAA
jgi:pimeloyl-ACP methyl ester carboxylesterase